MREKGIVKWFNAAKGFGFIQRASGEDVFVHFRRFSPPVTGAWTEGAEVEFEVKTGPKGLQAEKRRPSVTYGPFEWQEAASLLGRPLRFLLDDDGDRVALLGPY